MKHIQRAILIVIVLVSTGFFSRAEAKANPMQWEIQGTQFDPLLDSQNGGFKFLFKKNGIALIDKKIRIGINGSWSDLQTGAAGEGLVKLLKGKYKFTFFYDSLHTEVVTDSIAVTPMMRTTVAVYITERNVLIYTYKPVIYVYPQTPIDVRIKLNVKGKLDFTYPAYNNGWTFMAEPNGTIHTNGKQYDYLFWDGQVTVNAADPKMQEGFIVQKDSLVPFFENKLYAMGLSPREAQDFITFWCPLMDVNETNFVHFEFTKGYDQFAEIAITPKPDNLFRMFMVWSNANGLDAATIKPQQMEKANRSGFTVIEWGGAEAPELMKRMTSAVFVKSEF